MAVIQYLKYMGENKHGTIVIKSIAASSKERQKLRMFTYSRGMRARVGENDEVHPDQVKFLRRNHSDLFRIEEVEVSDVELFKANIARAVSEFQKETERPTGSIMRSINEAAISLLGVDIVSDDPRQMLEIILNRLLDGYSEDLDNNVLSETFQFAMEGFTPTTVKEMETSDMKPSEPKLSKLKRRK